MFLEKYRLLPNKLFGIIFWNMFFFLFVIHCIRGILILLGDPSVELEGVDISVTQNFLSNFIALPLFAVMISGLIWLFLKFGNLCLKLFIKFILMFKKS